MIELELIQYPHIGDNGFMGFVTNDTTSQVVAYLNFGTVSLASSLESIDDFDPSSTQYYIISNYLSVFPNHKKLIHIKYLHRENSSPSGYGISILHKFITEYGLSEPNTLFSLDIINTLEVRVTKLHKLYSSIGFKVLDVSDSDIIDNTHLPMILDLTDIESLDKFNNLSLVYDFSNINVIDSR